MRGVVPPVRSRWLRLLDGFTSIPCGVTLLGLLLLYCWLGSAGLAPFDYTWVASAHFELTEMEWFAAWPFQVLVGLTALCLLLTTLRRIPLTRYHLGVWTVHLGVLVLLGGAAYYFHTKIEGDVLVYRRAVVLELPGAGRPVRLPARPGAAAVVGRAPTGYRVRVVRTDPAYTLLTGSDRGKRTFAVHLRVEPLGGGEPFVRQLLAGYPHYTEDVLPGRGRAVKVRGRKLLVPALRARLEYAPTDTIYLADQAALYLRPVGGTTWRECPLPGLPRYHEYLADPRDAAFPAGEGLRVRPLLLPVRPREGELPVELRVTGFLPFAVLEERWVPGGETRRPLLEYTLSRGGETVHQVLLADDPTRAQGRDRLATRFVWAPDGAARDRALRRHRPRLLVRVKGRAAATTLSLAALTGGAVRVPGTAYRLRLVDFFPRWRLASGPRAGHWASVALVQVEGPRGRFTRSVVAPDVELSQDLDRTGRRHRGLLDPDLHLELRDLPHEGLTLVAGPDGRVTGVLRVRSGEQAVFPVPVGRTVSLAAGRYRLTVHAVSATARKVLRPRVIPRRERNPRDREFFTKLQVTLSAPGWERKVWLRFSPYPYPSRVGYFPQTVRLPDGRTWELVFSRASYRLPFAVALETFAVEHYPGGEEVRRYMSRIRFRTPAGWTPPVEVASNRPAAHRGWWFFQSTWDPPDAAAGYGGMNYSGLGVGNRNGVNVMLLGSVLIVLGSLYAFYVKPLLRRRAARRRPARGRVTAGAALGLVLLLAGGCRRGEGPPLSVGPDFARAVDLTPLRLLPVLDGGRVKTVDTLAREKLRLVDPALGRADDPVLRYLDLLFAPAHYRDLPLIVLPRKHLRRDLVQGVRARVAPARRTGALREAELERILATGRVSPAFLEHPAVGALLAGLARDVLRGGGRLVDELQTALLVARPEYLRGALKLLPPPKGSPLDPWSPLPLAAPAGAPRDAVHARLGEVPGLAPAVAQRLRAAWTRLAAAWRDQDAAAASAAVRELAATVRQVRPEAYPSPTRLAWDHWYHRHGKLTFAWVFYFAAVVFFLLGLVAAFPWAQRLALLAFLVGFGLHTAALGLRWYLAGRIPNANMYEAILASAWLGGVAGLGLLYLFRRTRLRATVGFAAAAYAMVAMMIGHFVPLTTASFSGDIRTVAPLLDRTIWLYIHTNLVIASYALISFAGFSAFLYLVLRALHEAWPRAVRLRRLWVGESAAPVSGGAAAVILGEGGLRRAGLARTLDATTMVFMELSFVLLWIGTVMGAVWADVSWGRPWGWDPKEVFALVTWLVFLILVHVRLRVRDKAFWTALLALVGLGVMVFNWYAVNFHIVGLHSYA